MDSPAIESFRLYGLHGYKNVEIVFNDLNRIVMAENGSGKTTVLSALAAFLNGEFASLEKLQFEKLECKFRNNDAILEVEHAQIGDVFSHTEYADLANSIDVPLPELRRALDGKKPVEQTVEELWRYSHTNRREIRELVTYARDQILSNTPEQIKEVQQTIDEIMDGTNVLHLPTYRRIEAPLKAARKRSTAMRARRIISGDETLPHSGVGVRYGLSDVEERLSELVAEIQRLSNQGYRQISASIIDDFLADTITHNIERQNLPSIESLRLFFSRVDQTTNSESRTDRLGELYEKGGIDSGDNITLKYFLSKLAVVIGQTEELESNIEKFVEQVNIYLGMSSDEKILRYNSSEMKVQVINTWTDGIVKMNDLSSGEKQVVSLFSYLYLYPSKNIVLIDEPELSLSIEWQRRLLMDVIDSPTCLQLLAITHSPFIFDNELDPIAGPMNVERQQRTENE